jgi:biopolymer transport protein ExbD
MAMNVGSGDDEEDEVSSTINTTPLVDVMLVLLIIFLITVPVITKQVPLKLPSETNVATKTKPENINISVSSGIDAAGDSSDPLGDGQPHIFWNGVAVADMNALFAKMKTAAAIKPQPEVLIRGDQAAPYEEVGKVVYACQLAGILKVGFILQPPLRGG